ncbi:hypothetical protein ACFLWG_03465 [Chloroflexota bacterium]
MLLICQSIAALILRKKEPSGY